MVKAISLMAKELPPFYATLAVTEPLILCRCAAFLRDREPARIGTRAGGRNLAELPTALVRGPGPAPAARCITAPVPRAWARKNTQHNTPRTPAGASLHPAAEARIDSTFRSHLGRFVPHRVPTHGIVTVTRFDGTLATPEASTLSTMYS